MHRCSLPHSIFKFAICAIVFVVVLLARSAALADVHITLQNDFIQKYMNSVTISVRAYEVDFTRKHQPAADGDMHVAGRSDEIGLATVAEVMNVQDYPAAANLIDNAIGQGTIGVSGVWRFWCEHSGGKDQVQNAPVPQFANSNPDHVFEIHPVTQVGNVSLEKSLKDIQGYTAKDAGAAFAKYQAANSEITLDDTTTTIRSPVIGYNYVDFWVLPVSGSQQTTDGGTWVYATVYDSGDNVLVRKLRMLFVAGSDEEAAIKALSQGEKLHVLGIPRIDLALVWYRRIHAINNPDILTWHLPYEMVIVGLIQ